jgi:Na+-translocating ferredoxin:NAD+ oxidoreductase RNF subunit RnfB
MDRIYPTAASKEEIELDNTVADYAQAIVNNKAAIRAAEAGIDEAEKKIKEALGQAERGRAGQYVISWPMRNYKAAPERLVPAKEAYSIRQSTLTIKELQS